MKRKKKPNVNEKTAQAVVTVPRSCPPSGRLPTFTGEWSSGPRSHLPSQLPAGACPLLHLNECRASGLILSRGCSESFLFEGSHYSCTATEQWALGFSLPPLWLVPLKMFPVDRSQSMESNVCVNLGSESVCL